MLLMMSGYVGLLEHSTLKDRRIINHPAPKKKPAGVHSHSDIQGRNLGKSFYKTWSTTKKIEIKKLKAAFS